MDRFKSNLLSAMQLCLVLLAILIAALLGALGDDVHPEFNSRFKINSTARHGSVYTLEGEIVAARATPLWWGMPLMIAEPDPAHSEGVK